jgi:hypothetical protein
MQEILTETIFQDGHSTYSDLVHICPLGVSVCWLWLRVWGLLRHCRTVLFFQIFGCDWEPQASPAFFSPDLIDLLF